MFELDVRERVGNGRAEMAGFISGRSDAIPGGGLAMLH